MAVERVDMNRSPVNYKDYSTCRHLRGRTRSGNLPIFVDPFSTWIHEVGNLPISSDSQIYLKLYFEGDSRSETTNIIGPDMSDLTQNHTEY